VLQMVQSSALEMVQSSVLQMVHSSVLQMVQSSVLQMVQSSALEMVQIIVPMTLGSQLENLNILFTICVEWYKHFDLCSTARCSKILHVMPCQSVSCHVRSSSRTYMS
jgi:hypothetical protein